VTSEGSVLSRLTIRFLEIFAAGVATAVSGYLIAHFSGYLAAPMPAAVVQQPPAIQLGVQSGSAPPVVNGTLPAASQPNTADQRPSSNGAGAKARDMGRDTARDATETKPREAVRSPAGPSFETRMRAALEKAGPANPASSEAGRRAPPPGRRAGRCHIAPEQRRAAPGRYADRFNCRRAAAGRQRVTRRTGRVAAQRRGADGGKYCGPIPHDSAPASSDGRDQVAAGRQRRCQSAGTCSSATAR
jgi:hypothetical protein